MKMIDVYMKMTNLEIKIGTKLIIVDYTFVYVKRWFSEASVSYRFEDMKEKMLEDYYDIDLDFLNKEVELITPNEKEYLIKFNMRGMDEKESYLKFYTSLNVVSLNVATQTRYAKSHFTKEEMQSIQPVREFLEDMEGKYELIEVEDNESMDS